MDNPFENETSGQADWDSALSANFQAIDRGYHMTERAGTAINTGQALTLDSSGFFHVADGSQNPAAYAYIAASSGDSMTALGWGIVRSLSVNSALVCGLPLYVNTTGYLVNSGILPVGVALSAGGILFNPPRTSGGLHLSDLVDVDTTDVASGKFLGWDDTSSKWTAQTPPSGGGSAPSVQYTVNGPTTLSLDGTALATKGLIFSPVDDIIIYGVTMPFVSSSGQTFKASVLEVSTAWQVSSQLAVSGSDIALTSNHETLKATITASLLAGHIYATVLTRTDATSTSSFSTLHGQSFLPGLPVQVLDGPSTDWPTLLACSLPSNLPPVATNSLAVSDSSYWVMGLYYSVASP